MIEYCAKLCGELPVLLAPLAYNAVPPLAAASLVETQLSGVPAMIVAVESASKATNVAAAGCTMTTALEVHKEQIPKTSSATNVTRVFMLVDGVCFFCRQISGTKNARIACGLNSTR